MIPKFPGTIVDGVFFHEDFARYSAYLNSFKEDTEVELVVRKVEDTVSDPLRKYYFKVVAKMISDETTHSVEVIHEDMKRKYSSDVDDVGIMTTYSVFSNESEIPISEKQQFIDLVKRWASDFLNLSIPDPSGVEYENYS